MSLFCSMKEGVSYLFLSATTYLLFCHVQPPPRSDVPHVCCRPSNGRKMQALTAVEWLTAVRYETDGRLANGWTDGLPENRLTGLGAGLPLTILSLAATLEPSIEPEPASFEPILSELISSRAETTSSTSSEPSQYRIRVG